MTGAYMWQTGPPCALMGTPLLDGAGGARGRHPQLRRGRHPGAYLINAATAAILKALLVGGGRVFSRPVFAQGTLVVATQTPGLDNAAP